VKPPAGPPWSVTDDDDRRRQTPATVSSLPPLCRRPVTMQQRSEEDRYVSELMQWLIEALHGLQQS